MSKNLYALAALWEGAKPQDSCVKLFTIWAESESGAIAEAIRMGQEEMRQQGSPFYICGEWNIIKVKV